MKGMTALLTGATGFLGNHLAHRLVRDGWVLHVLVRKNTDPDKLDVLPAEAVRHIYQETARQVYELVRKVRPNLVFHLASKVSSEIQNDDIDVLIQSNIVLGTQLLEAMAKTKTPYLINTGSYWQHSEGDYYSPVNIYAASKQAFEDIVTGYTTCGLIQAITLKLFDLYGPDDHRKKLFFYLGEAGGKPLEMTPGEQLLDFTYVADVVEAYVRAAKRLIMKQNEKPHESFAVSSGRHVSLKQAVKLYEKVTGKKLEIVWGALPYRPRQIMVPWKGKPLPGWRPKIDLKTGIRMMMEGELAWQTKS